MVITQRRRQDGQPCERRSRWLFYFCWLFFLSFPAQAQYRIDHWTADNGLPQNAVRDIVQTRDGYLWLATMALQAPVNLDRATAQLEEIAESSVSAIDEVREIAYALRPFHLDRLGLTKAIAEMAEKMTDANGIQLTIDLIPLDKLWPPEVEINIYRIVQESLNNIVKHAQATACNITARRTGRTIELAITDNGRGFSLNEPAANSPAATHQPKSGFGLLGMAERVRLLGGQWLIQSAPGAGTTVTIRLSVPEADTSRRGNQNDER